MYEIFEQLLQKFGVTTADVCKATGIGQSTISNWKSRGNLISGKNAQLIADYFGVSLDYLMTGKDNELHEFAEKYYMNDDAAKIAQEIYEKDKVLFDAYRSTDKDRLIAYAKKLMDLQKMEEGEE